MPLSEISMATSKSWLTDPRQLVRRIQMSGYSELYCTRAKGVTPTITAAHRVKRRPPLM